MLVNSPGALEAAGGGRTGVDGSAGWVTRNLLVKSPGAWEAGVGVTGGGDCGGCAARNMPVNSPAGLVAAGGGAGGWEGIAGAADGGAGGGAGWTSSAGRGIWNIRVNSRG